MNAELPFDKVAVSNEWINEKKFAYGKARNDET